MIQIKPVHIRFLNYFMFDSDQNERETENGKKEEGEIGKGESEGKKERKC